MGLEASTFNLFSNKSFSSNKNKVSTEIKFGIFIDSLKGELVTIYSNQLEDNCLSGLLIYFRLIYVSLGCFITGNPTFSPSFPLWCVKVPSDLISLWGLLLLGGVLTFEGVSWFAFE